MIVNVESNARLGTPGAGCGPARLLASGLPHLDPALIVSP